MAGRQIFFAVRGKETILFVRDRLRSADQEFDRLYRWQRKVIFAQQTFGTHNAADEISFKWRTFGSLFRNLYVQSTCPQILIADDDAALRDALSEAFQRRGYSTMLAADGQEALELVQSRMTLHLAILDIHMPRLSGLDTLEEIRRLNVPRLPCILMTAELDDAIERKARALADSPVLAKPFTLRTLTETVRDILHRTHGFSV